MITTSYVKVWMLAKRAMWCLRHPMLTSEHLLYACLRLHDQRYWEVCRDLRVTAESVLAHLKQNPPSEVSEDFSGLQLGVSAKAALERAEAKAGQYRLHITGTDALMRALLAETVGPVRSLLGGSNPAFSEVGHGGTVTVTESEQGSEHRSDPRCDPYPGRD